MNKKRITLFVKILSMIVLVGAISVGVWQFAKNYTFSKKATIKEQADKSNEENEKLKKQAEDQQSKINQLETDKKSLEDKVNYISENPKIITKTVTAPAPLPTIKLPTQTHCYWLGNDMYCTEY